MRPPSKGKDRDIEQTYYQRIGKNPVEDSDPSACVQGCPHDLDRLVLVPRLPWP